MKRFSVLIAAVLMGFTTLYAQKGPKIEKSISFDEPTNGWNKVLQLKNGNTFFFHFTKRDGIEVTIFDKKRKVIATKELESNLWDAKKLKQTRIVGLYEINNEPVLFMVQGEDLEPILYRIRFNPLRGNIAKEERIGSLPKINILKAMGGAINMDIVVEKDPLSDCYAVIYFNDQTRDKDDRIKVVHYDGNHKPINVGFYDSPDPDYKELNFIGAVVDGNKRVYLSVYGAESRRGKDGHVFISRLNAGDSVFATKPLDFTEDFKNTKSILCYNHTSNLLQLLTLTYVSGKTNVFTGRGKRTYSSFLTFIDPESMQLRSVKPIEGQKVQDYAQNKLQLSRDYQGLPQQMVINKDNSITVLTEEIALETKTHSTMGGGSAVYSQKTELGNIGVSELNEDGTERTGYMIMKRQVAGGLFQPLYISQRSKGRWVYERKYVDFNSYLSYDYINTEHSRYVIFNDNPQNFEKDEDEEKRKAVTSEEKLNTVCYELGADSVRKFNLFGDPDSKKESNSCFIEASDYQKSTNTYATVMIERDGRSREAKMVWITFE